MGSSVEGEVATILKKEFSDRGSTSVPSEPKFLNIQKLPFV